MSIPKIDAKPSVALSAREESDLLQEAWDALKRAYAPYSNFRIGAAVLTVEGRIFSGCNVENASYGLTICAERAAIATAVAAEGPNMKLRAVAVVSEIEASCAPCGACRQVIYEFGQDTTVLFRSGDGFDRLSISELLPVGFSLK